MSKINQEKQHAIEITTVNPILHISSNNLHLSLKEDAAVVYFDPK